MNRNEILFNEPEVRLIPNPVSWEKTLDMCDLHDGTNFNGVQNKNAMNAIKSFNSLVKRLGFKWMKAPKGVPIVFMNFSKNLNSFIIFFD